MSKNKFLYKSSSEDEYGGGLLGSDSEDDNSSDDEGIGLLDSDSEEHMISDHELSDSEKKDLPLPAAKPIAKAKNKYIDIAIRAICQANILFFFLINFNKNY